jgi:hypothetical protein
MSYDKLRTDLSVVFNLAKSAYKSPSEDVAREALRQAEALHTGLKGNLTSSKVRQDLASLINIFRGMLDGYSSDAMTPDMLKRVKTKLYEHLTSLQTNITEFLDKVQVQERDAIFQKPKKDESTEDAVEETSGDSVERALRKYHNLVTSQLPKKLTSEFTLVQLPVLPIFEGYVPPKVYTDLKTQRFLIERVESYCVFNEQWVLVFDKANVDGVGPAANEAYVNDVLDFINSHRNPKRSEHSAEEARTAAGRNLSLVTNFFATHSNFMYAWVMPFRNVQALRRIVPNKITRWGFPIIK